jgi:cytoskeletal protein RodZ
MEKEKKYRHWGWWALIGLVAILILIGLIIAAVVTRNTDEMDEAVIDGTTQVDSEDNKNAVDSEVNKEEDKKEEKKDSSSEEKRSTKNNSTNQTNKSKKEEPAVVTRCKSRAYMEKTLKGSTNIDCSSTAGLNAYKNMEASEDNSTTTTTPDSSAGPEVYEDVSQMPKSGPEDSMPFFIALASTSGLLTAVGVKSFAKRQR